MSIFVSKDQTFEILVYYTFGEGSDHVVISESKTDNWAKFVFRYPNWSDARAITSACASIVDGKATIDSARYTDLKIRRLLVAWDFSDSKKCDFHPDMIDSISPSIINYLGQKVDEKMKIVG